MKAAILKTHLCAHRVRNVIFISKCSFNFKSGFNVNLPYFFPLRNSTDVKPEDSGEIGCFIDTHNVRAFKEFTVYGKIFTR